MIFVTAYAQPPSGIDCGRILRKALAACDVSMKHAALHVGLNYEPTLSRGVNGLGPLDVHAIAALPLGVVFKFCRMLITARIKVWEREHLQDERRRA